MDFAKRLVKDWGANLIKSIPSDTKNLVQACQKIYDIAFKVLNSEKTAGNTEDHEFKTPLPLCATLLWKCHETYEIKDWHAAANATFDLPSDISIELLRQCTNYALIVYDIWPEMNRSMPQAISRIREVYGCQRSDIIAHGFLHRQPGEVLSEPLDINLPKFTMTIDHCMRNFVICIRGTFSIEDAVTDMLCDDDPFAEGVAHSGIISAVHSMEKNFKTAFLKAINEHPADYGIVLTGHSLGGGTAVLLTLHMHCDPFWRSVLKDKDIKCLAFAPPPVYHSKNGIPTGVKENIHVFVNNGDMVPRASMATLAQFIMDLKTLDENIFMPVDVIGVLRRNDLQEVARYQNLLNNKLQSNFAFLEHPGTCYRISLTDTDELAIQRIESTALDRKIILFKSLIADHSMLKYQYIIQKEPYLQSNSEEAAASSQQHNT